jgi:hypothetical protein
MKNPEMRKMMNNMMKNITPEQMKSMAGMGGMKMTDAQAEAMAKQMQGMKEEDLERMMKVRRVSLKNLNCIQGFSLRGDSEQARGSAQVATDPHDPLGRCWLFRRVREPLAWGPASKAPGLLKEPEAPF